MPPPDQMQTAPDPRAELERLRKIKRLRELEAKAGGQPAVPAAPANPALLSPLRPDARGQGAGMSQTGMQAPQQRGPVMAPAQRTQMEYDRSGAKARGWRPEQFAAVQRAQGGSKDPADVMALRSWNNSDSFANEMPSFDPTNMMNPDLKPAEPMTNPVKRAARAMTNTLAETGNMALEGFDFVRGATEPGVRIPTLDVPEPQNIEQAAADLTGTLGGLALPLGQVGVGFRAGGQALRGVDAIGDVARAITPQGTRMIDKATRYAGRMAATLPENAVQAGLAGAILGGEGNRVESAAEFASDPINYVAQPIASLLNRAGIYIRSGGQRVTPEFVQVQRAAEVLQRGNATPDQIAAASRVIDDLTPPANGLAPQALQTRVQPPPAQAAPQPSTVPPVAQAGPPGAGQQANAGGGGQPVLNAAPVAPQLSRAQVREARDTALILGRILKAGGIKNDAVRGYLPGLVQRYESLGNSRIPLARFVERDLPQYFPEGVAGDVITKLRGYGRERGASAGPKDTSRHTVQDTIKSLRSSQQDHLTDVIRSNTYKKELIDAEDKIRADMRLNAEAGYETALANGMERFSQGRATADEAEAWAKLEGLMKSEPFISRIPEHVKVRAIREGKPIEVRIEEDPFRTAHWLQSALGKAERAAEGLGGVNTSESLLYGELRQAILEPLEKVVPGYKGARKAHGDLFGADEAIDFGEDLFLAARSEVETARKARNFKKLSKQQQTVATMSIRDKLLNEFRGTPEDAAAKLTRLQQEGALDAVERILGADGKRITAAIRETVEENDWLRSIDQGSGSNTFSNFAGAADAAENVKGPMNKAVESLGDKRTYVGAAIGDALLMGVGVPPVLTVGKATTDIVGAAGRPSARTLSNATKGLYSLPAPKAPETPVAAPRVRGPRKPPASPGAVQETLDDLLKQYDQIDHRNDPEGSARLLKKIDTLRKRAARLAAPPAPPATRKPPPGTTSQSPPMIGGMALGGLTTGGATYVATGDEDLALKAGLVGAVAGGVAGSRLAKGGKKPPAVKAPPANWPPKPTAEPPAPGNIRAYHGSRHEFDEFELSDNTVGTGEGTQSRGYGLYFAERPNLANFYRQVGQNSGSAEDFAGSLLYHEGGDVEKVRAFLKGEIKKAGRTDPTQYKQALTALNRGRATDMSAKQGAFYEVDLNAQGDDLFDLDAPLSGQTEIVRSRVADAWQKLKGDAPLDPEATGYDVLMAMGNNKTASDALSANGIKGTQFLDRASREAKSGTRNYVMFDPKNVAVRNKQTPASTPKPPPVANGLGSSGKLPMDEASRMARAREMGFDTETVLYHGTTADFEQFELGDLGFHVGTSEQANKRLRALERDRGTDGANVLPVLVRAKKPLELPDVGEWNDPRIVAEKLAVTPWGRKHQSTLLEIAEDAAEDARMFEDVDAWKADGNAQNLLQEIRQLIEADGYDSVKYHNQVENAYGDKPGLTRSAQRRRTELLEKKADLNRNRPQKPPPRLGATKDEVDEWIFAKDPEVPPEMQKQIDDINAELDRLEGQTETPFSYIIFDPANIRGKFAKFDPAETASSKLLAGMGGNATLPAAGAIGGYAFAPDQNGDGVVDATERGAGGLGGLASGLIARGAMGKGRAGPPRVRNGVKPPPAAMGTPGRKGAPEGAQVSLPPRLAADLNKSKVSPATRDVLNENASLPPGERKSVMEATGWSDDVLRIAAPYIRSGTRMESEVGNRIARLVEQANANPVEYALRQTMAKGAYEEAQKRFKQASSARSRASKNLENLRNRNLMNPNQPAIQQQLTVHKQRRDDAEQFLSEAARLRDEAKIMLDRADVELMSLSQVRAFANAEIQRITDALGAGGKAAPGTAQLPSYNPMVKAPVAVPKPGFGNRPNKRAAEELAHLLFEQDMAEKFAKIQNGSITPTQRNVFQQVMSWYARHPSLAVISGLGAAGSITGYVALAGDQGERSKQARENARKRSGQPEPELPGPPAWDWEKLSRNPRFAGDTQAALQALGYKIGKIDNSMRRADGKRTETEKALYHFLWTLDNTRDPNAPPTEAEWDALKEAALQARRKN